MKIKSHFTSYRESLAKDVLDGYQEFSKATPTAQPETYPTVFDYLNFVVNNVRMAVLTDKAQDYKVWLQRHRAGMIALFEKMVEDVMPSTVGLGVYDLIKERGWNWFKFSPVGVSMQMTLQKQTPEQVTVNWVPRYSQKFALTWNTPGEATFDADELSQFWKLTDNPTAATWPAIEFKRDHPGQKLIRVDMTDGAGYYKPVNQVNSDDTVVDWTLTLF
jgi:hypothetical protein